MKSLRRIYNYYISPRKYFAKRITALLGSIPSDLNIFIKCFTLAKSGNGSVAHNERLEYLGDALLGAIVARYLYKKYPLKDEGFLTKMRSKIVSRKSLNTVAKKMGLDILILAQNQNLKEVTPSVMGNTLESFIGAIYLEKGYGFTKKFVINKLVKRFIDIEYLEEFDDNYKSQLLEHTQKESLPLRYETLLAFRKNKRDKFKVGVFINNQMISVAEGYSKKSAEQEASRSALRMLNLGTHEQLINQQKPSGAL